MQSNHTPGPWRIVTDGISNWVEIEPNKISLVKAKKADLSLIAAAPDMLAALDLAYNALASWIDNAHWDSEDEEALERISSAITKAKGV